MGRRTRDQAGTRFPLFMAFGAAREFLTTEEAAVATTEARIRSVWPFLVRRVLEFQRTLKAREQANFDAEDTLAELWIELALKDHKWAPERGKYITFAGTICAHALHAIRDRAQTVEAPRNSGCRLKEYEREEAAGTITDKRAKTAADIRRSTGEFEPHDGGAGWPGRGPDDDAMAREGRRRAADALADSIRRKLSPIEAAVLGQSYGLWGREPRTTEEIAARTGWRPAAIKRARIGAREKILQALRATGVGSDPG